MPASTDTYTCSERGTFHTKLSRMRVVYLQRNTLVRRFSRIRSLSEIEKRCPEPDSIVARRRARTRESALHNQTLTESLSLSLSLRSAGTYFTAAVRSSLSQAKGRPWMARFRVRNRTMEKTWRYAKRCSHTWLSSQASSRASGWRRSRAKASAEAMKSMTRKVTKKNSSRWKLAGSVDSGWKCFWMKYQITPTTNMTSMKGETNGSRIWKMRMLGSATNPNAPSRAKTPLCLKMACRIPNDQRKRWRMSAWALVGASVKASARSSYSTR